MSPVNPFADWLPLDDVLDMAEKSATSLLEEKAGPRLASWFLADFETRGELPDDYWQRDVGAGDADFLAELSFYIRNLRAIREAVDAGELEEALRLAVIWMTDPKEWWDPELTKRLQRMSGRQSRRGPMPGVTQVIQEWLIHRMNEGEKTRAKDLRSHLAKFTRISPKCGCLPDEREFEVWLEECSSTDVRVCERLAPSNHTPVMDGKTEYRQFSTIETKYLPKIKKALRGRFGR